MKLIFPAIILALSTTCHNRNSKTTAVSKTDSVARVDSMKTIAPYNFDKNKPYPYESGIIMYKYSGDYEGTQKLYFRDYGRQQRVEDSFVNKKSAMQNPTRQVFISDSARLYFIDLIKNNGYYIKRTDTTYMLQGNLLNDMTRIGIDSTMRKNGYKLKGIENVSGKNCRIYTSGSSKFCFYNGINIKTDMLGQQFKYTLEAVKIEENAVFDNDLFAPPASIRLQEYKTFVKSQTRDKL
jgi:hypothetical protein